MPSFPDFDGGTLHGTASISLTPSMMSTNRRGYNPLDYAQQQYNVQQQQEAFRRMAAQQGGLPPQPRYRPDYNDRVDDKTLSEITEGPRPMTSIDYQEMLCEALRLLDATGKSEHLSLTTRRWWKDHKAKDNDAIEKWR